MFLEQILGWRKDETGEKLKHLGFVRVIALNVLICASDLYGQVKKHSGPLKSTFGAAENAVIFAVDPFYQYFKGVPDELLLFADNKVDAVANVVDRLVPRWVKKLVRYVRSMIGLSIEIAETLIKVTKSNGPKAAIALAWTLFAEILITQWTSLLYFVMRSKTMRYLIKLAIPVAAKCGQIYNKLVQFMKAKGFPFARHLALIPVVELLLAYEAIEKAVILAELGEDVISDIPGAGIIISRK
uniref:Small rubber particle protein n=1 Tax=Eucommia ulmoides TaxID=4392 RepID=A0A6G8QUL0_EUCUL|nr:small rubber particle protein [Eucommia ulmoides]